MPLVNLSATKLSSSPPSPANTLLLNFISVSILCAHHQLTGSLTPQLSLILNPSLPSHLILSSVYPTMKILHVLLIVSCSGSSCFSVHSCHHQSTAPMLLYAPVLKKRKMGNGFCSFKWAMDFVALQF